MKLTKIANCLIAVSILVFNVASGASANAQSAPEKAEVRAIKGAAYTTPNPGASKQPLKVRDVIKSGATVETGPASMVDLFLGKSAGMVRVTENTTLVIDKFLLTDTGADKVVDVELKVSQGIIMGNVHKLATASKYEIKVPNGLAGIRGTKYRISSTGYIFLLEGTLVFVYTAPGSTNSVPYTLQAPPPVYFSPIEGVKPASQEQIKELQGEWLTLGPAAATATSSSQDPPPSLVDDPAVSQRFPYPTTTPVSP